MNTFTLDLTQNRSKEDWDNLQAVMDKVHNETVDYIQSLAKELNVSEGCAWDVWYLRGRSRHTPELEKELIELYAQGNPPNILAGDF